MHKGCNIYKFSELTIDWCPEVIKTQYYLTESRFVHFVTIWVISAELQQDIEAGNMTRIVQMIFNANLDTLSVKSLTSYDMDSWVTWSFDCYQSQLV